MGRGIKQMPKLDELREKIDCIDENLVRLLEDRAQLVLGVKAAKAEDQISIYSPERERQILDRVTALARGGSFPIASLERVFGAIISATRSLIGELTISYLGPEGSLSHEAATRQFGQDVKLFPMSSVHDVFAHVEQGLANYGVVPADSSSGGLHTATFEAFLRSNLRIVAELSVQSRLVLLSQDVPLAQIQEVFGEPQGFQLSGQWLRTNLPEARLIVEDNTLLALKRPQSSAHSAVIAPSSLAERSGLKVSASGIESDAGLSERFLVVGIRSPKPSGQDKTSLVCGVKDRSGALIDLLRPFADRGLTLCKIESKPMPGRAWGYLFCIDVAGHEDDPGVNDAIRSVSAIASEVRVLGSYPLSCK